MELLIVRLGTQVIGIPSFEVEQILAMVEVTPLPDRDARVLGMVNLHGDVLLVADPRPALGLPSPPAHPDQRLIVISGTPPFLLWVDAVDELAQVDSAEFDPGQDRQGMLATAVVTLAGRPIAVLDLGAFRPAAELSAGRA